MSHLSAKRSTSRCQGVSRNGHRCSNSSAGLFQFGINGTAHQARLCGTHLRDRVRVYGEALAILAYCGPCGDEHKPGDCRPF